MAVVTYGRALPTRYVRARARALSAARSGITLQSTITEIEGKILSIKQVMVSGVESAAYGDKRTEFRSLDELREILSSA